MAGHERIQLDVEDLVDGFKKGNKRFIESAEKKAPGVFKTRSKGQMPHTAVVECADSWVALGLITKTPFGRIFTITKNAANIVDAEDKDTAANATYALNHTPAVNLIVVNGHYDCGGIKGLDQMSSGKLEREVEEHLERALPALHFVESMIEKKKLPLEERHNAIVEANVLFGIASLHGIQAVREAAGRTIQIKGTIYDPFSGELHWGYPTLEKHGLVQTAQKHFQKLVAKRFER
ncbi:MAG: carbonic anhydrase [Candidatus Micrarchaeota archaeon]